MRTGTQKLEMSQPSLSWQSGSRALGTCFITWRWSTHNKLNMAAIRKQCLFFLLILGILCLVWRTDSLFNAGNIKSIDIDEVLMKQDLSALSSHKISKRSLRHQLFKRDAGDTVCKVQGEGYYQDNLKKAHNFASKVSHQNHTERIMFNRTTQKSLLAEWGRCDHKYIKLPTHVCSY